MAERLPAVEEQLSLFGEPQAEMAYIGAEPIKAYPDDAGFDLQVDGRHLIWPGQFATVPLQTRILAPPGHWMLILGRSSSFHRRHLLVNPGVIDPSYTGPLFAVVYGLGFERVQLEHGERICQAIPIWNHGERVTPVPVDQFAPTPRGESGFGSSGQ